MDYVITFSDVMAGVITLGMGIITFFLKGWFDNLNGSTEEIKKQIKENDEKVNKRIDKLEQRTDAEIESLKKELISIEKDFPIVYVQRDDFFRSMNNVEEKIRGMDGKLDKLLLQNERTQGR